MAPRGILGRRSRRAAIRCFATTDLGLVRLTNQDAAYARCVDGVSVLAVADGMGGPPAGDIASALVIAAFEQPIAQGEAPEHYLAEVVRGARRAILEEVARHPERAGMGSTAVAAVVRNGRAWVANVGDSRAYLWSGGQLHVLSEDHSVAGEAVRAGKMDAATARATPARHLLTRAVGGSHSEPDFVGPVALDGASALLLVSDGVCGVLDDEEIREVVRSRRGPEVARGLIERVHAAGAPDNIAIALLDERS